MRFQRKTSGEQLRLGKWQESGCYLVLAAIFSLAFYAAPVWPQSSNDSVIRYHNTVTAGLAASGSVSGDAPGTSEIGFDYLYRVNPKWEFGVQLDLAYEKGFGEPEAYIIVPIAAYSITNRVPLFFGVGVEHRKATDENEAVVRVGSEYAIFLNKDERLMLLPGGFLDWVDGELNISVVLALGYMF
jgi:hypothetical protein